MKPSTQDRLWLLVVAMLNGFGRMFETILCCVIALRVAKWLNIL